MPASKTVSRLQTHFLTTAHPLSKADAVEILGSVLFYLREMDVVRSLSEMHANNAAQGTVETLRYQLWREVYGGAR
jgi:hypothetical protein